MIPVWNMGCVIIPVAIISLIAERDMAISGDVQTENNLLAVFILKSEGGPGVVPEGRDYAAARMRPSTSSGETKSEKCILLI